MADSAAADRQGSTAREPDGTAIQNGPPTTGPSSVPVLPAVRTPRGGGAIKGIGEKFGTNPVTGTASTTVPIPVSPGRAGFGPSLSLSYDSGNGNGVWGFGWALGLPSISRRTDKGLPRYADAEESDVFLLSGAEDLVPVLQHGNRHADTTSVPGFSIHRYRPRIEGLFARIERWVDLATGATHWRSIDRDNVTTLYGLGADSRIEDGQRVFEWLICESHDDRGNAIVYEYLPEDGAGIDDARPGDAVRDRARMRYLKRVLYGNETSRLVRPDAADWLFEVVFDYADGHFESLLADPGRPVDEQLELIRAGADATKAWPPRIDPFSTYRAGFEVRTHRRCSKVLMFHRFPELGPEPCLVRSTDFVYGDLDTVGREIPVEEELAHSGSTRFASFLCSVVQAGYTKAAANRTYVRKTFPPLEFSYSRAQIDDTVHTLGKESLRNLPVGLDGNVYQWADLDGVGLPGILSQQAGTWYYKRNLGRARFGPTQKLPDRPSAVSLEAGRGQLMDLAGDGRLDAVILAGADSGFSARTDAGGWAPYRSLTSVPAVAWDDPNLRFADLSGDGLADVLVAEGDAFTWYASRGKDGFAPGRRVPHQDDGGRGPRLVFADNERALYLADMSGDGLVDLVRIRNGQVAYWPGLGYGHFGDRIVLANSPWFDRPDKFDQRRIRLADLDGSGTTDIVYLSGDGVRIYFNQSGNRISDPRRLRAFPGTDQFSTIQVADLLGNGTACLVWSSPLSAATRDPLRYVDLMGGTKPHLLVTTVNNLGSETHVEYTSSTACFLADMEAGQPWITRLPFPVHVVRRVETIDRVSGTRFVTRYDYHHGYFDQHEREFRGFAMVEQRDTEQYADLVRAGPGSNESEASHVPPVLTRTWYHTGVSYDQEQISDHLAREYYREPGQDDAQAQAQLLPDTVLPPHLDIDTRREACRALKGTLLRQEVYAQDDTHQAAHPYVLTEQNFTVEVIQERGPNQHAVLFTHPREAISRHYERDPVDPRVSHDFTLAVDEFGNVLRSASVGYGRRNPDASLAPVDQAAQARTHIVLTESTYTNAVDSANDYRLPGPVDTTAYELTGLGPTGAAGQYSREDIDSAFGAAAEIDYVTNPVAGSLQKRVTERTRQLYRADDLTGPLPMGQLGARGLPYESYRLALTEGLLTEVFGNRVTPAMLSDEAHYVWLPGAAGWWIPSGTVYFSPNPAHTAAEELAFARASFFQAHRHRGPFHTAAAPTETIVEYDIHHLIPYRSRDAMGNTTVASALDYRTLQPTEVTDPNLNRTAVVFDALGMVAATAVMGKLPPAPVEGDRIPAGFVADLPQAQIDSAFADPRAPVARSLLGEASTRFVYNPHAYRRSAASAHPSPACVCFLAREIHRSDGALSPVQVSITYTDGLGRQIQVKAQAEPGEVPARDPNGHIVLGADDLPVAAPGVSARWVGTGWAVYNNKGNPVRKYEPFFTDTHRFEAEARVGVTPVLCHDPVGRVVATVHPDHSWEKVVFDPWQRSVWDVNDTVLIADPATDPDVGGLLARLPVDEVRPTWCELRTDPALGADRARLWPDPLDLAAQQRAAAQTSVHAATPHVTHTDSLGRAVLTVAHNRHAYSDAPAGSVPAEDRFITRTILDVEGNEIEVVDALGRVVMRYDYDVAGHRIHQSGMDSGQRWSLPDVADAALYAWDSRDHRTRIEHDALRRPVRTFLQEGGAAEKLIASTVFGESLPLPEVHNLRTRVVQVRDQAGLVTMNEYDFKGNPRNAARQVAQLYNAILDWTGNVSLLPGPMVQRTRYDALNRPVQETALHEDVAGTAVNLVQRSYNEAGLLERVDSWLQLDTEPTALLDPTTASLAAVTAIDYDAKGQRRKIVYGNGVETDYTYDRFTLRLARLTTRRGPDIVQDLAYTYDPTGNITALRDAAQQTLFFRNTRVDPSSDYLYDATYRLIEATGREHLGQNGASRPSSYDDAGRVGLPHPGDGNAMGRYLERYVYDAVGNIRSLQHRGSDAATPGWTRDFTYAEASQHEAAKSGNRLTRSSVGGTTDVFSTAGDGYDEHGSMLAMPQLREMRWDHRDQLRMTRRQVVNTGDADGVAHAGERTWYVYDATGQRIRKVTESAPGVIKESRLYVGLCEVYERRGGSPLVRESLHLMDDKQRVALVETRLSGAEPGVPARLVRFQLANHLASVAVELDDQAQLVSYEEYTPYGSSSYQAVHSRTEAPKRYRHMSRERDGESGLTYCTARYLAPWLGRWTSCDPAGFSEGTNLYAVAGGNPASRTDPRGTQSFGGPWSSGPDRAVLDAMNAIAAPVNKVVNYGTGLAEGVGEGGVELVKGLGQMVLHPINTAQGIGHVVGHPIESGKAIWSSAREFGGRVASGDPRAIGRAAFEVALIVAPLTKIAAVRKVAAAAEITEGVVDVARVAETAEAARVATAAKTVTEASEVAQQVVRSGAVAETAGETARVAEAAAVGTEAAAAGTEVASESVRRVNLVDRMQKFVHESRDVVDKAIAAGDRVTVREFLSSKQSALMFAKGRLAKAFRGTFIELRTRYVWALDPEISANVGRGAFLKARGAVVRGTVKNGIADFFGVENGLLSNMAIDITSEAQRAAHLARGYLEKGLILTY